MRVKSERWHKTTDKLDKELMKEDLAWYEAFDDGFDGGPGLWAKKTELRSRVI